MIFQTNYIPIANAKRRFNYYYIICYMCILGGVKSNHPGGEIKFL